MDVGDFDVVAEDLVVADFEGGDFGALGFLGLEAGHPALAVALDAAEFVEFGGVAVADETAFLEDGGGLGVDGGGDEGAGFLDGVDAAADLAEARGVGGGEAFFEGGHRFE